MLINLSLWWCVSACVPFASSRCHELACDHDISCSCSLVIFCFVFVISFNGFFFINVSAGSAVSIGAHFKVGIKRKNTVLSTSMRHDVASTLI